MDREPRWLSAEEQRAWRGFIEGNQRLIEVLNRDLQKKHDLTMADYRILVMLSESPDHSLRMSDLADGVLASRSKLTHQIRRMETRGMVRRSTCVDDGRGVLAHLTDEGERRLKEAAPTHVEGVRANFLDLLTPDELPLIADAFVKVDNAIMQRESGRSTSSD